MSLSRKVVLAAAAAFVLAACGGSSGTPDVEVVGTPRAAVPAAGSSQVAITLANRGDGDDRLVGATTSAALGTELHVSQGEGTAVTEMDVVDAIDVPAGQELVFRPGQTHLMLVVPDETVRLGATLELVLEFERSEDLTVEVEVVELVDLFEGTRDPEPDGDDADGTS